MKLHELLDVMECTEQINVSVYGVDYGTTVEDIRADVPELLTKEVLSVWRSTLFNAIMIEVER